MEVVGVPTAQDLKPPVVGLADGADDLRQVSPSQSPNSPP